MEGLHRCDHGVEDDRAGFGRLAGKAAVMATRWYGIMQTHPPFEDIDRLIHRGLEAVGEADNRSARRS